mmetsp:Transcript_21681/g.48272  ORF Transcript_21681/g.48272 Transcript_21681/m.48272 type:complete len:216 (+) Transcript_21681:812-1459(+)
MEQAGSQLSSYHTHGQQQSHHTRHTGALRPRSRAGRTRRRPQRHRLGPPQLEPHLHLRGRQAGPDLGHHHQAGVDRRSDTGLLCRGGDQPAAVGQQPRRLGSHLLLRPPAGAEGLIPLHLVHSTQYTAPQLLSCPSCPSCPSSQHPAPSTQYAHIQQPAPSRTGDLRAGSSPPTAHTPPAYRLSPRTPVAETGAPPPPPFSVEEATVVSLIIPGI